MTNYLLMGGSGFIGASLALKIAAESNASVKVACRHPERARRLVGIGNIETIRAEFGRGCDFASLVRGVDVVVHLVSSTVPNRSNLSVPDEFEDIPATAELLETCCSSSVSRVLFVSSGGTVYGKGEPPFPENAPTWPISSYGLQKVAIEKLLHLYGHLRGLDYRIVRPSNPCGPFQSPFGGQGVIAAFVRAALVGEDLVLFGDGSVVRDFLYIDDLTDGLLRVLRHEGSSRVFNLGSGCGMSIIDVARTILSLIPSNSRIRFAEGRDVDVPENVLDMSRFESEVGSLHLTDFEEGILRTADQQRTFLRRGA